MMISTKRPPYDNIVRPIKYGYYRLNGIDYSNLGEVMAVALEIELPLQNPIYNCSFNTLEDGEDEICSFSTRHFNEIIDTVYHYPIQFKCTGLNKKEKEFINKILEYRIEEKLKT